LANKLVLNGVAPYDGEYEFDVSYFTMRELNIIKRTSGVRAGELEEALAASDSDLVVALAVIALERAGVKGAEDALWNAQAGQITLELDDEGDDVGPPDVPAAA
jgi:hypothetical protein